MIGFLGSSFLKHHHLTSCFWSKLWLARKGWPLGGVRVPSCPSIAIGHSPCTLSLTGLLCIMVHECKNAMCEQGARNRGLLPETGFASWWMLSQNIQSSQSVGEGKIYLQQSSKENTSDCCPEQQNSGSFKLKVHAFSWRSLGWWVQALVDWSCKHQKRCAWEWWWG